MMYRPEVTLLIAAYNEAHILRDKIQNCLQLRYPKEKLKILFVTDGSTDKSNEILKEYDSISFDYSPKREGKLAAIHRVMEKIESEIVISTDANCLLNEEAILNIVRHYQNPAVGAVAGEKRIRKDDVDSGEGEGIYWKYESFLKKMDSDLYSVVGAAGELFSFRRTLFEKIPTNIIIEDFVLSLRIAMKGYKVAYEPDAYALEAPSANWKEEWKRKVRICAGGFQAAGYLSGLWNPLRYGWLSFQYVSHRLLRWMVVPFLFPLILVATFVLASQGGFYQVLLMLEITSLVGVGLGLLLMDRVKIPKQLLAVTYLVLMNAAAYAGLWRYLMQSQSVVWDKAKRSGE